ncbi:MAG: deoxynucleoside kinase [Candidatus Moraniibacteriota bacterium]
MKNKKGKFIVIDGLDGSGKSVFLDTFHRECERDGKKVFDVNKFWENYNRLPTLNELESYQALYTSEPTFYQLGKFLREVLISKNSPVKYSTEVVAQAYALDRHILYEGLILPFLEKGGVVFQSRSVSTSLVYQKITGEEDGMDLEELLKLPGNRFALKNAPDYLIILNLNPEQILERLKNRKKQDDAIFEKIDFQRKANNEFRSKWFRETFEKEGSRVVYMDAGKTLEYSKKQIKDFYQKEFKHENSDKKNQ